jgi:hypothetical protein
MLNEILRQIEIINDSLAWIKRNKPNDYELRFFSLVEERRKLKVLARAAAENPAIAAFGASQVGKSYLMSCLLQDKGQPFMVSDNKGKEYNFINSINPIGDGQEATGVVTRFSSFSRDTDKYSKEYPALVRTLSVIDIVLILSDTYFNDIDDYTTFNSDEIKAECERLKQKYSSREELPTPVLEADDILELKQYFRKHINNAQIYTNSNIFDTMSLLINRIPTDDYCKVFSLLWYRNEHITKLFECLMGILSRLGFSQYIYLPIEAVVHNGIKENTVMSVTCLSQLLDNNNKYVTTVYRKTDNGYVELGTFTKSAVCAICSEVVFRIGEEFLDSSGRYSIENVSEKSRNILREKGEIQMSILRNNDLLDFPGARAREKGRVAKLANNEELLNGLLRGKVAYLFNKYNEARNINILLYCHNQKNNDATTIWRLLDDWVNTYVGHNLEERQETINNCGGVPPLFHVGTMFNLDMEEKQNPEQNKENALRDRWTGRFGTVLLDHCFHATNDSWAQNWSKESRSFRNCYMLRDYKYSGAIGSRLYEGWDETHREQKLMLKEDYYKLLRTTFVENSYVQRLFENPGLAWDVAASQNNDGALYIIEKLSVVAENMEGTRNELFRREINAVKAVVRDNLVDYYSSEDEAEILQQNISKALKVRRELDFTCNNDNYYFGHLLQALQISEAVSYDVVHSLVNNPDLNSQVNDYNQYVIIRNRCIKEGYDFDQLKTEEKWNALLAVYHFPNREVAEEYLRSHNVDAQLLISSQYKLQLNSYIIAKALFAAWCERLKSKAFMTEYADNCNFDSGVMLYLIENMIVSAKAVGLEERMADLIAVYVNVINLAAVNVNFLADILADVINNFVLDFGYRYLSDERKISVRKVANSNNLHLEYVDRELPEEKVYDEADLTALFNEMTQRPEALARPFEEQSNKWIEYMIISFVSHLEHPELDVEANKELKGILDSLKK